MVNLRVPEPAASLSPRIMVIGVGGAGGNAVNNMIRAQLEGVEFIVANTDAQALARSEADAKIQLGVGITGGLGAGARPDIGMAAAEEAIDEILARCAGTHMLFITAGLGGGTGTGAAPVIARAARDQGILTVGVVTKPFHFEGSHRMRVAERGLAELQQYVDTLIVIPNQNLFRIANERTTFAEAFSLADQVLHSGVRGITDLIVMPGLINLDFADIRTVMSEMGKAMMGTGEAEGDRRAIEAAEAAISNPLLDEVSLNGAKAMLINITGGMDLQLFEVDQAVNAIREQVDPDANIIFGTSIDAAMDGRMRVSVVATGIDSEAASQPDGGEIGNVHRLAPRRTMDHPAPALAARSRGSSGGATAVARQPVVADAPMAQHEDAAEALAQATADSLDEAQPALIDEPFEIHVSSYDMVTQSVDLPASGYHAAPEVDEDEPLSLTQPVVAKAPEPAQPQRAFIPPAPARVPAQPLAPPRSQPVADPLAAADYENGGRRPVAPATPSAPGFFDRAMRNLMPGRGDAQPAAAEPPPLPLEARAPAKATKPAPAPQAQAEMDIAQTRRVPLSAQPDERMLEIPTFLRKQAN